MYYTGLNVTSGPICSHDWQNTSSSYYNHHQIGSISHHQLFMLAYMPWSNTICWNVLIMVIFASEWDVYFFPVNAIVDVLETQAARASTAMVLICFFFLEYLICSLGVSLHSHINLEITVSPHSQTSLCIHKLKRFYTALHVDYSSSNSHAVWRPLISDNLFVIADALWREVGGLLNPSSRMIHHSISIIKHRGVDRLTHWLWYNISAILQTTF